MRSFFVPILAGATFGDRLMACAGAATGIICTAILSAIMVESGSNTLLLMGPIGASAVLIFAVPASPLTQPWPVIGGNMLSALVGIAVAYLVSSPQLASGLAVGLAILAMSLLRCLHPPGGAVALTAVIGAPAAMGPDWLFPLIPVGINSLILAALGVAYHRVSNHSYPHRSSVVIEANPSPQTELMIHHQDLDRALAELGETFDIGRDDLEMLLDKVRHYAAIRIEGDAPSSISR